MATAAPVEVVVATGLAAGILIDAVVTPDAPRPRTLVSVFGRWNWWLPEPARPVAAAAEPEARTRVGFLRSSQAGFEQLTEAT